MLTRLRKKSLSIPNGKSATQFDALCAIIGPRGYILLPPNFAILSPQKTFSAASYAWRFRGDCVPGPLLLGLRTESPCVSMRTDATFLLSECPGQATSRFRRNRSRAL